MRITTIGQLLLRQRGGFICHPVDVEGDVLEVSPKELRTTIAGVTGLPSWIAFGDLNGEQLESLTLALEAEFERRQVLPQLIAEFAEQAASAAEKELTEAKVRTIPEMAGHLLASLGTAANRLRELERLAKEFLNRKAA